MRFWRCAPNITLAPLKIGRLRPMELSIICCAEATMTTRKPVGGITSLNISAVIAAA